MNDLDRMKAIIDAQPKGFCWRCRTYGNKLLIDPLFDDDNDKQVVALCRKCCRARTNVRARYQSLGVWITPQRRIANG